MLLSSTVFFSHLHFPGHEQHLIEKIFNEHFKNQCSFHPPHVDTHIDSLADRLLRTIDENHWKRASNKTSSISIDDIDSAECKADEFRVEKADLPHHAEALQSPLTFHCQQRTVFSSMEGLCAFEKSVLPMYVQRHDSSIWEPVLVRLGQLPTPSPPLLGSLKVRTAIAEIQYLASTLASSDSILYESAPLFVSIVYTH